MPDEKVEVEVLSSAIQKPINEIKRFSVFTLASFGACCAAFGYAFNLISSPLQKRYDFTQRDMTTITTVGLVVKYFLIPYGIGYDFFGPIFTAILCTILLPLGSVLLSLSFSGHIGGSVVRLSVFQAIYSVGCILFDVTCIVTTLNHFPSQRGIVVAFLKTYATLGSSLVACLYSAFFANNTSNYFFFLMAYGLVCGLLCCAFMKQPGYYITGFQQRRLSPEELAVRKARKVQYFRQKPPTVRFVYPFVLMIFLVIFLPVQSICVAFLKLGQKEKNAFAGIVIAIMGLYALTPLPMERVFRCKRRRSAESEQGESADAEENALDEVNDLDNIDEEVYEIEEHKVKEKADPLEDEIVETEQKPDPKSEKKVMTEVDFIAPQYQNSFWRNLLTLNLWALLFTLFAIVGTEAVIINNANYIYAAFAQKEPTTEERSMLTALQGGGSSVGRLLMSAVEMWTQHRPPEKRIPITIAPFIAAVFVVLACVLFVSVPGSVLALPFLLAGIGNGFQSAGTILVARTLFAKDPAKHYNFCNLSVSFSSILLNRFLWGEWNTVQAEKLGDPTKCLKKRCALMPFLVMGGLGLLAFVSSTYVHFKYIRFCKKVLAERARLRNELADTPHEEEVPSSERASTFSANHKEEAIAAEGVTAEDTKAPDDDAAFRK